MYQLYTSEHTAADQRAQQLNHAHTARLLRDARAQQPSHLARIQAWWRAQVAPITGRAAEQPTAR